eukprot:CAMPEP_0115077622 /NCGR_PEP_ID=MMETSP0227-20121206/17099_1 /TAXON_ID=89957 /ORGANISM="Polarella glacialis, Strain CCMP 1383" /LENGTH=141 /DNA_ID=CAMNT_0002464923 /DNA_START=45 /DNA_END=470 /DNA_ORIENTATION=+
MGAEASQPLKKGAGSLLRRAGEPLNTLGYPVVHEKAMMPPGGKPVRLTICRCWQSLRFPLCDNTHQRLQKQGVNVGPVMLEIKSAPIAPVGAGDANAGCCGGGGGDDRRLTSLGGPQAAVLGGVAAAGVAGVASWTGSFPM